MMDDPSRDSRIPESSFSAQSLGNISTSHGFFPAAVVSRNPCSNLGSGSERFQGREEVIYHCVGQHPSLREAFRYFYRNEFSGKFRSHAVSVNHQSKLYPVIIG